MRRYATPVLWLRQTVGFNLRLPSDHRYAIPDTQRSPRSPRNLRIEYVTLVVLDLMLVEERAVFFLKGFDPMMFALPTNVFRDVRHLGFTDRECAVAILP